MAQIVTNFDVPITSDTNKFWSGYNSLLFQNAGTTNAVINDRFTIQPGASLTLGSQTDYKENTVVVPEFSIVFVSVGSGEGDINRLEIVTTKIQNEYC